MALQSLDIVRRSATTIPAPDARGAPAGEVAKLIDVTKCIGCKACQSPAGVERPAHIGTCRQLHQSTISATRPDAVPYRIRGRKATSSG